MRMLMIMLLHFAHLPSPKNKLSSARYVTKAIRHDTAAGQKELTICKELDKERSLEFGVLEFRDCEKEGWWEILLMCIWFWGC